MLYNLSKTNALSLLQGYLKKSNEKFYVSNTEINLSEYINFNHQNYVNLLSKYTTYIDNLLKNIDDEKFKINNDWYYVVFEDGLFFEDVFTIKSVLFIRRKKLNEFLYKNNIDEDFTCLLFLNRINIIFYVNFEMWKKFIEETHVCKFLNIENYEMENKQLLYKNTNYNFMDNYIIIYNNCYTFVEKIVDTKISFSPFFDRNLYKINIENNKLNLIKEEYNDLLYINPFDMIKKEMEYCYF